MPQKKSRSEFVAGLLSFKHLSYLGFKKQTIKVLRKIECWCLMKLNFLMVKKKLDYEAISKRFNKFFVNVWCA